MICVDKLTHGYYRNGERNEIYSNFSEKFEIGINGLVGPSGCGKSTLLSLIMGLQQPWSGHIDYFGKTIHDFGTHKFGYVGQESELIEQLTVFENVYWRALLFFPEKEAYQRTTYLLQKCGLDSFNAKSENISGGQKQRVALARALVSDPEVIICDEISAHLDLETSRNILDLLRQEAESKIIILATHDPLYIDSCKKVVNIAKKLEKS